MEKIELTSEFSEILDILENTRDSIFITGKAGTGKSSLLKYFVEKTKKKYVILAPTGVASLNVGGQTIHSFFRFPPEFINVNSLVPDYVRADLFKSLDMVIIDEVSMVRSDLMNGIDIALRKNLNKKDIPFGGIQMVFIGDLFQLPPVLTPKERNEILTKFTGQYFFDSPVFKVLDYEIKELTRVFRQTHNQVRFIDMLNRIRNNTSVFDDMVLLNSRHKDNVKQHDDSITLSTTRAIAKAFNKEKLDSLKGECTVYWGSLRGTFKENANIDDERHDDKLPAPYKLELKKDAQIIMLKNDPDLRWVNGSIGKIQKLKSDCIWVNIKGKKHRVEKELWTETDYVLDPESNDIDKITVGEYLQFPLSLAYAITIHKSQGKTFDKITVDVGTGAFAHGQVYVALSRCRSIEGIVLDNPINDKDIIVDPRIIEFINSGQIPEQTLFPANEPTQIIRDKIINAIEKELHVFIEYQNASGGTSQRELSKISFPDESDKKFASRNLIKAFCHLAEEERTFRIDRILSIETL